MDEKVLASTLSLFQTGLWVGVIVWVFIRFGGTLDALLKSLGNRISQGDKVSTPWLSVEAVPESLKSNRAGVATSEGAAGAGQNPDVTKILAAKQYPDTVCEFIYLVHTATVIRERTPSQKGLYRVRVWVESYDPAVRRNIERVSYRLYNDEFPEPVVATASHANNFELWLNVYGEFSVVAYVERRTDHPFWMVRYLDLPGRPPE
jgi:hypothetical protein